MSAPIHFPMFGTFLRPGQGLDNWSANYPQSRVTPCYSSNNLHILHFQQSNAQISMYILCRRISSIDFLIFWRCSDIKMNQNCHFSIDVCLASKLLMKSRSVFAPLILCAMSSSPRQWPAIMETRHHVWTYFGLLMMWVLRKSFEFLFFILSFFIVTIYHFCQFSVVRGVLSIQNQCFSIYLSLLSSFRDG